MHRNDSVVTPRLWWLWLVQAGTNILVMAGLVCASSVATSAIRRALSAARAPWVADILGVSFTAALVSCYLVWWQRSVYHRVAASAMAALPTNLGYGLHALRKRETWIEIVLVTGAIAMPLHVVGLLLLRNSPVNWAWMAYAAFAAALLSSFAQTVASTNGLRLRQSGQSAAILIPIPLVVPAGFAVLATQVPTYAASIWSPAFFVCLVFTFAFYAVADLAAWGKVRRYEIARRAFADAADTPDGDIRDAAVPLPLAFGQVGPPTSDPREMKLHLLTLIRSGDARQGVHLVEQFPRHSEAQRADYYVYRTRLWLSLDRPEKALEEVGSFRAALPGHESARMTSYEAVAYMDMGEFAKAKELLEAAIEKRGRDQRIAYWHMYLAECHFQIGGETDQGLALAIEQARIALYAHPEGCLYVKTGLAFYLAIGVHDALSADGCSAVDPRLSEALLLIVQSLATHDDALRAGPRRLSLREFEAVIGAENAVLLSTYALVLLKLGALYPAEEALHDCIRIAKTSPTVWYLTAYLAQLTGDSRRRAYCLKTSRGLMRNGYDGYLKRLVEKEYASPPTA